MPTRNAEIRIRRLIYCGLALATVCVYLPVLHSDFVNYDDQQYVVDNPRVQAGLTWKGLVWAFGFYAGNWHPLTWITHMLDCQLYQAWAGGHHLTNLLLHVASTLLLFAVLDRMTGAPWRSAAVAALFAWHPLHVESVAWVAERKDVLCAFFWMLTLLSYAKYATDHRQRAGPEQPAPSAITVARKSRFYWLTLFFFALALMAKPMAVTLPFVLLILDFWPLGRVGKGGPPGAPGRVVVEKIPFMALAAGACILTLMAQQSAIVSTAGLTVPQRVAHALVAYGHYVWAMFVPLNLAVYYPYQIRPAAGSVVAAVVFVGLVTGIALMQIRRRPYLLAGWLWYLGTLVPVIGLVQVGDQAWADRYTYLPLIGPFIMVVWTAADLVRSRRILQCASAVVAAGLLTLTWRQVGCWKNTQTLFEHADRVTPNNYLAITMLGSILATEHQYGEAIAQYRKALSYEPAFPEAHFFLGAALDEQGKLDEALAEYQQALWFKPTQEQAHIFMGIALAREKRYDEATAHYQAALKLNPDSAVTYNNLARVYHSEGRIDEAVSNYNAALELDPKLALARNNLGILLLQRGRLDDGVSELRQALALNPTNSETRFNLALALNEKREWNVAVQLFSESISNHPADASAHFQFALALDHVKKTRQAMSEFASALLIQPDFPNALDGLAWILSTDNHPEIRNGGQAVSMAERACYLTGNKDPKKLATLAAAYAEVGRFADATNALGSAMVLTTGSREPDLGQKCGLMLRQFQQSAPWRE